MLVVIHSPTRSTLGMTTSAALVLFILRGLPPNKQSFTTWGSYQAIPVTAPEAKQHAGDSA
jgi:hypothetical protein